MTSPSEAIPMAVRGCPHLRTDLASALLAIALAACGGGDQAADSDTRDVAPPSAIARSAALGAVTTQADAADAAAHRTHAAAEMSGVGPSAAPSVGQPSAATGTSAASGTASTLSASAYRRSPG